MIDRSPCGTGTCAIMAILHAKGELQIGETFIHESIVGSKFIGKIVQEITLSYDGRKAIIPEIEGNAWITQYSEVVVCPTDPFQEGYRVADIW
jgi:proline racemase